MQRKVNQWIILITSTVLGVATPTTMTIPQLVVRAETTVNNGSSTDTAAANAAITKVTTTNETAVNADVVSESTSTSSTASNSGDDNSNSSANTVSSNVSASSSISEANTNGSTTAKTRAAPVAASATTITVGTVVSNLDSNGVLTLESGDLGTLSGSSSPWQEYADEITSIDIAGTITNTAGSSYAFLFAGMSNLTTIDGLKNLQMQNVTGTASMFQNDTSLTVVSFNQTDFTQVKDMTGMFNDCTALTGVTGITDWQVPKATNLANLFANCISLTSIDLSRWQVPNVTSISAMFSGCTALTEVKMVNFEANSAKGDMKLFTGCIALENVDMSGMAVNKVMSVGSLFSGLKGLTTVRLNGFQANSALVASTMFYNCTRLSQVDMTGIQLKKVTSITSMFSSCEALTKVDMSNGQLDAVTSMGDLFYQCTQLTSFITTGWTANNIQDMGRTFGYCSALTNLDLSDWDTSQVTDFINTFISCTKLSTITFKNTKFVTSNVTNMANMFSGCNSLKSLDVSGWQVDNVTTMSQAFNGCQVLSDLDVSSWNTAKIQNLNQTFFNCWALTALDLSKWHTDSLQNLNLTFYGCKGITALTLSGPDWDTSKLTTFTNTFTGMPNLLTLDLSSWDTSNVTAYTGAFNGASKLQHLTLGPKFTFKNSTEMGLIAPSTASPYTGEWQNVATGDTYTASDLMTQYDGSTMAGQYNWATKGGTVTVKYLDGDGSTIAATETLTGAEGKKYTTSGKTINGYTLKTTPANAAGTYTDQPITVTYVYDGDLFFNSAPTTVDFGSHVLSGTMETYAASVDQPLAVQNNGTLGSEWQLTAELGSDGFVGTTSGKSLAARLYYQNSDVQTTLMPGVSSVVYTQVTANHNSVNLSNGWSKTAGLILEVLNGAATIDTYQATVSWSLSDTVANN